jgi:hypothetical protein
LEHIGWAAVNLGCPYVLPLMMIKLMRILLSETYHATLRKRLRITYLVREGQYALTSLAVGMAALYELHELGERSTRTNWWFAALILFLLIAVILVVVGLIAETADPETAVPPGSGVFRMTTIQNWVRTYRVGAATLILVLPISLVAYLIHDAVTTRNAVTTQTLPQAPNAMPTTTSPQK